MTVIMGEMFTLPSKRVLSIFILTAALVAAVIIAFGREKSSEAINFASNLVAGEKLSPPENPNWQNELGRVSTDVKPAQTGDDASDEETSTDKISKTLMSNYLALKQNGSLNQESAQKLVDQTVDYLGKSGSINIEAPKLNVVPDNGVQTIANYGENLGIILKMNRSDQTKNEIVILQEAIDKRDSQKIGELQEAIDVYEKIADEMMKMPVPKIFVKAHTDTIIGMESMILGLKKMKNVLIDPVVGLQGIQTFQIGGSLFIEAVKASSEFIKQNGVVYKQGSGGYYLFYGI